MGNWYFCEKDRRAVERLLYGQEFLCCQIGIVPASSITNGSFIVFEVYLSEEQELLPYGPQFVRDYLQRNNCVDRVELLNPSQIIAVSFADTLVRDLGSAISSSSLDYKERNNASECQKELIKFIPPAGNLQDLFPHSLPVSIGDGQNIDIFFQDGISRSQLAGKMDLLAEMIFLSAWIFRQIPQKRDYLRLAANKILNLSKVLRKAPQEKPIAADICKETNEVRADCQPKAL